jgi:hypothetical protein
MSIAAVGATKFGRTPARRICSPGMPPEVATIGNEAVDDMMTAGPLKHLGGHR